MPRGRYEFRARGRLSEEVAGEVEELEVARAAPETVLSGEVVDDAHLDGVLARFSSLGLHVLSMREVPWPVKDPSRWVRSRPRPLAL